MAESAGVQQQQPADRAQGVLWFTVGGGVLFVRSNGRGSWIWRVNRLPVIALSLCA